MPYYAWRGVDILGSYKKGKIYARTPESLDEVLFKREIALLSFRIVSWRWKYRPVSAQLKIEFFKQLAVLLEGGVSLPEALSIVAEQLSHPGMQEIIHELANRVDHGNAFSVALCTYEHAFDPITIQLIKAGEESGALAESLAQIATRLEMREEFARAVRAAIILPVLTFVFFIGISFFLFIFVVPRFADLFASMNQELPSSTLSMLAVSEFLASRLALILAGLMGVIAYGAWGYGKTARGKQIIDRLVIQLPIVNSVLRYRFIAYFTASLALLLDRGLQLVPALHTIAESIENNQFKQWVIAIQQEVSRGRSLSAALQDSSGGFPAELIALVHVGENSGTLDILLKKSSLRYQDHVKRLLKRITSLVQPCLMIVLGALVLLLIFAIYLPIIQLSHVV